MPRGDATGPAGLGPMTGRGVGYCAGYNTPGYMNSYGGRGYFGRGRGWRNWYRATGLPGWQRAGIGLPAWGGQVYPPPYSAYPAVPYQPTPREEKEMLAQEKEMLSQELEGLKEGIKAIEERLGELEGSKKVKK